MTTALDIVTGAARLLGVTYKSETLSDDEANDGLTALNDLLGSWSNDGLLIYAYTEESFALTTGDGTYTIGVGQNFNTVRPISIKHAFVRQDSVDYELDIISQTEYNSIPFKTSGNSLPQVMSYDNAYPYATINIYPLPSAGYTLHIESKKPITSLTALTTTFDMPPGWNRAAKYNLAIEMAPLFSDNPPSDAIVEVARKSLGALKRSTLVNRPMPFLGPVLSYSSYPTIISDGV